ncbi:hypothetical protein ACERK3_04960 [Phycisphaerales bacterium AB-hyl4]|uniref:Uncharacterized protein n=1 Tax=Natronomicrosphaera hydrolytica TaxID=3242702 RepID=A0ABV4U386_9BACT
MLIAILLPTLSTARQTAYRIQCASNHRQTGIAALMYVEDFNQYMAPVRAVSDGGNFWYDRMHVYIGRDLGTAGRFERDETGHVWHCPADFDADLKRVSLAVSRGVGFGDGSGDDIFVRYGQMWRYAASPFSVEPLLGSLSNTGWFADVAQQTYIRHPQASNGGFFNWVHPNDTINAVFMDGHVENIPDPDFFTNLDARSDPFWANFFSMP